MTTTKLCPCCAQPMLVDLHEANQSWRITQIAVVRRMRSNRIPWTVIARIFGATDGSVREIARVTKRKNAA